MGTPPQTIAGWLDQPLDKACEQAAELLVEILAVRGLGGEEIPPPLTGVFGSVHTEWILCGTGDRFDSVPG